MARLWQPNTDNDKHLVCSWCEKVNLTVAGVPNLVKKHQ